MLYSTTMVPKSPYPGRDSLSKLHSMFPPTGWFPSWTFPYSTQHSGQTSFIVNALSMQSLQNPCPHLGKTSGFVQSSWHMEHSPRCSWPDSTVRSLPFNTCFFWRISLATSDRKEMFLRSQLRNTTTTTTTTTTTKKEMKKEKKNYSKHSGCFRSQSSLVLQSMSSLTHNPSAPKYSSRHFIFHRKCVYFA